MAGWLVNSSIALIHHVIHSGCIPISQLKSHIHVPTIVCRASTGLCTSYLLQDPDVPSGETRYRTSFHLKACPVVLRKVQLSSPYHSKECNFPPSQGLDFRHLSSLREGRRMAQGRSGNFHHHRRRWSGTAGTNGGGNGVGWRNDFRLDQTSGQICGKELVSLLVEHMTLRHHGEDVCRRVIGRRYTCRTESSLPKICNSVTLME
ncbi:hypothetical protein K402DRAFT_70121 [Aulographum hederae CBS 113979]|uniref:Uncharacterized protein n=1 Tax=Aulographum hederae CBS 113979 TaxID=1176131 RepID=A0A6G1HFK8_9PEZI|nr:hypothetical protein K402DRAFT_70121 [Aulographum hederae CBS 113979]